MNLILTEKKETFAAFMARRTCTANEQKLQSTKKYF